MQKITIILILFLTQISSTGACQTRNIEKKDSIRENLQGHFFSNEKFCELFEEYVDEYCRHESTKYVYIMVNKCPDDSLYTIRINNFSSSSLFAEAAPNRNIIFIYGGMYKGKHIIIEYESIFGKLMRTEYNFVKKIEKYDKDMYRRWVNSDYKDNNEYFEGCFTINLNSIFLRFKMSLSGDISEVEYRIGYRNSDMEWPYPHS